MDQQDLRHRVALILEAEEPPASAKTRDALAVRLALAATLSLAACHTGARSPGVTEFGQTIDGNWIVLDRGRPNESFYSYARVTCGPSGQATITVEQSPESADWVIADRYRSRSGPYLAREIRFARTSERINARKIDRTSPMVVTNRGHGIEEYDYLIQEGVYGDAQPFPFPLPACAQEAFAPSS